MSACSSSSTPSAPSSLNQPPTNTGTTGTTYTQRAVVAVPNGLNPPASWVDISWIESATGNYIVADRANKGVTQINTKTLAYINSVGGSSTAGGPYFTGILASPGKGLNISGPDGIVGTGGGVVFVGDGNSNYQVVNVQSNTMLTPTPAGCATTTNPTGKGLTAASNICGIWTGGQGRVDEMAFDPVDNVVIAVNNSDPTPFATFINASAPYNILGKLSFANANGNGAEQPIWVPGLGAFIVPLPGPSTNPTGELDIVNPKTFLVTGVYAEPTNCNANGLALNPANNALFLGCNNALSGNPPQPLIVMNALTGATLATIPAAGGADEVWFDTFSKRFYAASSSDTLSDGKTANPVLSVVDATSFALIAMVPTTASAHSVAVDPVTGNVFVPLVGAAAVGTNGVGVYNYR